MATTTGATGRARPRSTHQTQVRRAFHARADHDPAPRTPPGTRRRGCRRVCRATEGAHAFRECATRGHARTRLRSRQWHPDAVKVYVAGALTNASAVQAVQEALVAAGHQLSLDWTRGPDIDFVGGYDSDLAASARIAAADLDGVMDADAVLVVAASEHEGRGMFVELGAALARARAGDLAHVVVVGPIHHDSVFHYHPAVQRASTVEEWLSSVP